MWRLLRGVCLTLAGVGVGMLFCGGFLTMDPPMIEPEMAREIRKIGLALAGVFGLLSFLFDKIEKRFALLRDDGDRR